MTHADTRLADYLDDLAIARELPWFVALEEGFDFCKYCRNPELELEQDYNNLDRIDLVCTGCGETQ